MGSGWPVGGGILSNSSVFYNVQCIHTVVQCRERIGDHIVNVFAIRIVFGFLTVPAWIVAARGLHDTNEKKSRARVFCDALGPAHVMFHHESIYCIICGWKTPRRIIFIRTVAGRQADAPVGPRLTRGSATAGRGDATASPRPEGATTGTKTTTSTTTPQPHPKHNTHSRRTQNIPFPKSTNTPPNKNETHE